MRRALILALLVQSSPLPAAAANFSEGRPIGEPVIRALPEIKLGTPGVLIENAGGIPSIPETALAIPQAGLIQAETPALQPQAEAALGVMPGLEAVGAKLEQSAAPGAAPEAGERALDYAFDKWEDEGGAVHAAVEVSPEETGAPRLATARDSNESAPAAPPSTPSSPKQTPRWYNIFPNLVTTGNLWSGLAGAYLASQGRVVPAAIAIIAANIFDALDGRTARALKVKNPLGIDYDSLADVVSFGIAPALLVFKAVLLPTLGVWGFPIAAAFASAGWFRLARFNVGAHAEESGAAPAKKSDSFTGLPIPGGAGVVVAAVLALASVPVAIAAPAAAVITLLAAAAMASRLPYPAFKKGGVKALVMPAAAVLAAAVPLAAFGLYAMIPAAVFGLYLATGPLVWLWRGGSDLWKKELKRKAFHQLLLLSIPAFYLVGLPHAAAVAMTAVLAVGLVELVRLKVPAARPFFDRWFGKIIRAKEADRMSGSFYVALGLGTVAAAVALLHLNPLIFPAAALTLALGDAASPLVGLRFGFKPYKVMGTLRSVDGTLAGFAVVLAIGLAFGFPWFAALGAALAFSVVDTIPVKPDDNLWIPIAYSAALALLSLI